MVVKSVKPEKVYEHTVDRDDVISQLHSRIEKLESEQKKYKQIVANLTKLLCNE